MKRSLGQGLDALFSRSETVEKDTRDDIKMIKVQPGSCQGKFPPEDAVCAYLLVESHGDGLV